MIDVLPVSTPSCVSPQGNNHSPVSQQKRNRGSFENPIGVLFPSLRTCLYTFIDSSGRNPLRDSFYGLNCFWNYNFYHSSSNSFRSDIESDTSGGLCVAFIHEVVFPLAKNPFVFNVERFANLCHLSKLVIVFRSWRGSDIISFERR